MAIFGSLETVRAQIKHSPALTSAFAHAERCLTPGTDENKRLMALAPDASGRVELEHGAFALEQCYLTKPGDQVCWESHKVYLDVQAVIAGDEVMEVADVTDLSVSEDLTPEKDVIFHHPYAAASRLRAGKGFVAIFFPVDGHRPGLAVDSPAPVRKVVVKVPV
jgi:biofilm protein TabA